MLEAKRKRHIPMVFISSTAEDLAPYRAKARDAAIRAGFHVVMQEYFVAKDNPPVKECLERVSETDVLVAIVAHRYGWVPKDQPGRDTKSITWLECQQALGDGKEILAFVVDPKYEWPKELEESYRITAAVKEKKATPELLAEVQRNDSKLQEFKQWLESPRIRGVFSTPDGLRADVEAALHNWLKSHPEFTELSQAEGGDDPHEYLEALREQTAWIDIRGLQVGTQKAHKFSIEDLYIPLIAAGGPAEREHALPADKMLSPMQSMELQDALAHRRLVIVGDPGSGKTTFLRHIAFALADAFFKKDMETDSASVGQGAPLKEDQVAASFLKRLDAAFRQSMSQTGYNRNRKQAKKESDRPLPVLIRIAALAEHIRKSLERPGYPGPATTNAPGWIADFMKSQNEEYNWGLMKATFASS